MKVKFKTIIYNKANPYGKEKTCIFEGVEVEKPGYLCGCDDSIFLKNELGQIAIIERKRILKIY